MKTKSWHYTCYEHAMARMMKLAEKKAVALLNIQHEPSCPTLSQRDASKCTCGDSLEYEVVQVR